MAPKTYSLPVKVPHLLRDTGNMNLQKIELPRAYEVDLKVQITTKNGKEPPTAVKTRLDAAALEVFVYYEKIIKEEAKKLDKKIVKLLDGAPTEANQNKAEIMIRDTNTSIGGALRGAQNAADKAVKAVMVKEAKSDQLLKESKIVAIVKITTSGFKLAQSIIKLVATSGAALGSYKTAITSMYKIYEEVNNALKSQDKLKKEFDKQVALLLRDPKNDRNVKNFEAARKLFRDSCTKTREKADDMSAVADKMMKQATKGGGPSQWRFH